MSSDPSVSSNDHLPSAPIAKPSYDDIALRAYFIALDRHRRGEAGDPLRDWVEAERQFQESALPPEPPSAAAQ